MAQSNHISEDLQHEQPLPPIQPEYVTATLIAEERTVAECATTIDGIPVLGVATTRQEKHKFVLAKMHFPRENQMCALVTKHGGKYRIYAFRKHGMDAWVYVDHQAALKVFADYPWSTEPNIAATTRRVIGGNVGLAQAVDYPIDNKVDTTRVITDLQAFLGQTAQSQSQSESQSTSDDAEREYPDYEDVDAPDPF